MDVGAGMTWLDTIRLELENMGPDLIEPSTEVRQGDHTIDATVDAAHKRIYTLAMLQKKFREQAVLEARYACSRDVWRREVKRAVEFEKKAEILMEILWTSLKDSLDLWDKARLGIRKDWTLVWVETSQGNSIYEVLGEQ